MADELRYKWAGITPDEFNEDLDELWAELKRPDSALSRAAQNEGIDVAALRDIDRKDAIEVSKEGEGFIPEAIVIIVALAPVATATIKAVTPIIQDVWKHILLPRILQRRNGNALIPAE